MAGHTQFSDRAQENRQRLANVERDELMAGRDAFREAEAQRRAEAASQRALNAEGRLAVSQESLALQKQKAEIEQQQRELQMQAEQRKLDRTLEVTKQGVGFLKDARGMNPSAPEFDNQLQEMLAGYPDAAEHPGVKEWLGYNLPLRQKVVERTAKQQEEDAARKRALQAATGMQPKQVVVDGVTMAIPETPKPANLGTERTTVKYDDGTSKTTIKPIQPEPVAAIPTTVAGGATGIVAGRDAAANQPDITPEIHATLKPGEKFWWKGQQLTKQ